MQMVVSFAAVIRVVTQRSSQLSGEERCVTTLVTAEGDYADGGTLEV